jgi:hypothetical protein
MAYMVRVKLHGSTAQGAAVTAAAATYGAVGADELAIYVGSTITGRRKGVQLHARLVSLSHHITRKPAAAPPAGSVATFLFGPDDSVSKAPRADVLNATVCNESKIGIVVGATVAAYLARSGPVATAVLQALKRYRRDVSLKA